MIRILVMVPAFNEEENIVNVIRNINDAKGLLTETQVDVVVINDGSVDRTRQNAESTGVTVLDLPYNVGIGGAVQTGFKYAVRCGYDIAIQVDGDGQHDPQFIPDLIRPILDGRYDVVIGSRFLDPARTGFQSTFVRRMGIRIFYWVNSIIIRQRITDNTSGFRAFNKRTVLMLAHEYPSDYPEPETVIVLGLRKFRIAEVPVIMRERQGGQSSIGSMASFYYMVKVLLAILINVFKKEQS